MRILWMIRFRVLYAIRNEVFAAVGVGQMLFWFPALLNIASRAFDPGFNLNGVQFVAFGQYTAWFAASVTVVMLCSSPHAAEESDADLSLVPASDRELLLATAGAGFVLYSLLYIPSVLAMAICVSELFMHPGTVILFSSSGFAIGALVALVTAVASVGRARSEAVAATSRLLVVCAAFSFALLYAWTRLLSPAERGNLLDAGGLPSSIFGRPDHSSLLTTAVLLIATGALCGLMIAFVDLYRRMHPRFV